MNTMTVMVNGEAVHDYDRDSVLSPEQLAFLERMDQDMDRGIKVQGELIPQPDSKQRARFVALNLIKALQQENPATIAVSCAYLSTRLPGLAEVQVRDVGQRIEVEFITA